jgi:hypothetical protein
MEEMTMEKELLTQFVDLACRLSPENLYCDGLATRADAELKLRRIWAEWEVLEKKLGRSVSEDEVWKLQMEKCS